MESHDTEDLTNLMVLRLINIQTWCPFVGFMETLSVIVITHENSTTVLR